MAQQNNWQQFQGTELGSVLAGIYGNKPKINYPKPKQSKTAFNPNSQRFGPVNAKVVHGASDPKRATRRDTSGILVVPHGFTGGQQRQAYHPIQFTEKRKAAAEMKEEMLVQKERTRAYRPAFKGRMIGEAEKERFTQICAFKGGKGLMEGVVAEATTAPFELAEIKKQKDMESRFRSTRKGLSARVERDPNLPKPAPTALNDKERLASQIQQEIDERCDYLEEMQGMGAISKKDQAQVKDEIKQRTLELVSLGI